MPVMEDPTTNISSEDLKSHYFSFESVSSIANNDPDINFLNDDFEEIKLPYLSVENVKTISNQVNKIFFILS